MDTGSASQPCTGTLPLGPLARLLSDVPYSLAEWYATPLSRAAAGTLLGATQRAIQARLRRGGSCTPLQVLRQIACFWLEGPAGISVLCRALPGPDARETALQELVYGQLLASRKLLPAPAHLAHGFRLAAPLLEAADYFRVLREHELLAALPYSDIPAPARDLTSLLNEAAVIRRLQHGSRRRPARPHLDTLG